jgi:hypothetical protein
MAKDTDSLDLTDGQKTRLLNLALGPSALGEPPDEDEERGDLLHDILRCSLPLREESRAGATASSQGLRSVVGPPMGELLQDPKTSVAVQKEIKQYAKTRGSEAASDRERDVFLAIYFAAIAGALTYHATRITEHSDHDLKEFFNSFAEAAWIPSHLGRLFAKAPECCAGHSQTGSDRKP